MAEQKVTRDVTTPIGTLSFPHLFKAQAEANENDKGEPVYDVQIIIPKSERAGLKAIVAALTEVGEAKWGKEKWKKVRIPLRDGDKEADDLTDDGSTKAEKYPERIGCYFINARSKKPVGVYDRQQVPISEVDEVYGGCKGRISVSFYPYASNGNTGIGASLNAVQKTGEGTPFGNARPTVESMFDMLEDEPDTGLDGLTDDEPEVEAKPPAKKAAAKKAAAKPKPEPEPEVTDLTDDLGLDDSGDGDDDPFSDLDD